MRRPRGANRSASTRRWRELFRQRRTSGSRVSRRALRTSSPAPGDRRAPPLLLGETIAANARFNDSALFLILWELCVNIQYARFLGGIRTHILFALMYSIFHLLPLCHFLWLQITRFYRRHICSTFFIHFNAFFPVTIIVKSNISSFFS